MDKVYAETPQVSEEQVEQLLIDLLSEGLVYEPEIHRYKWAYPALRPGSKKVRELAAEWRSPQQF